MPFDRRFFRPLGALSIFAADPMIEGGLMAASAFFREGDYFRLFVAALSTFGAVLLLIAGIMLCFKRIAGRTVTYVAAWISAPIAIFSTAIGLMGSHALMYGAGYPIVIVLLLRRATPSDGLPATTEEVERRSSRAPGLRPDGSRASLVPAVNPIDVALVTPEHA